MPTKTTWIRIIAVLLALPLAALVSGQTKTAKKVAARAKYPVVAMETTAGTIKIEVFTDKAPVTAKNFLGYVNSGFYTGTIFHRIVPDFVVQGGGYLVDMTPKLTKPGIKNESKNGLKNLRGTLSMARHADANSATSQFFINLKDNPHLDPLPGGWGYAVFAKVVEGMEVVDKIAKVKTATRSIRGTAFDNVPLQAIAVKSAKVLP